MRRWFGPYYFSSLVFMAAQHKGGHTVAISVDPGRCLQVLKIGWTHVKVPQGIGMLGLEPDRRRLTCHVVVVVAKATQMPVQG